MKSIDYKLLIAWTDERTFMAAEKVRSGYQHSLDVPVILTAVMGFRLGNGYT
jgi:hypothetical protein